MIDIWQPRWHDRKVLIAKYKVHEGDNEIRFTKTPSLEGIYLIDGLAIRQSPLESNGRIECYAVSLDNILERPIYTTR